MSNFDLVLRLFLQMGVILASCRLISYIGKQYFRQTTVVCEMIAGVLLGPSFLGLFFPSIQQWLFPVTNIQLTNGQFISNPSMIILFSISQIGVVIYMFLIGLEFNTELIRHYFKSASSILIAGILFPLFLGFCLAPYLYNLHIFFGENVTQFDAMLFVGTALSITAFPMLARILYENKIIKTKIGTLTLAAASMDDAIGWCLLAFILAIRKNDILVILLALIGSSSYILFMLTLGKKILKFIFDFFSENENQLSVTLMAIIFSIIMFCAWFTDFCGVYAIFGSFIAGVAMPKGKIADEFRNRTEHFTSTFLLPTFFVYSGLNTQIGLINSANLIMITLIIIVVAILGKGVGCTLAARIHGENWNNSFIVGTLMNARGLMELIILNIGLAYGIITPTFFTMFVIMAVVTTVLASPLYYYFHAKEEMRNKLDLIKNNEKQFEENI